MSLDPWFLEHLRCPVSGDTLRQRGNWLITRSGKRYPVVSGVPVMLLEEFGATIDVARASLSLAEAAAEGEIDPTGLYLPSVGLPDDARRKVELLVKQETDVDPVVSGMIQATAGNAYKHLVGTDLAYPIPRLPFTSCSDELLLDLGCNWGRWTFAAEVADFTAVGLDPQLGSVLAARRLASQRGASARFVVGDARYLPFRAGLFDRVWSYSVLQHLAPSDVALALHSVHGALRPNGVASVQMASATGFRSLYHLVRRHSRAPSGFDVRYWSPREIRRVFTEIIGPTKLSADCYLGLGLQSSDYRLMRGSARAALLMSEAGKRLSNMIPALVYVADSLLVTSIRQA
jgi:SAM-dependent methyltransferase